MHSQVIDQLTGPAPPGITNFNVGFPIIWWRKNFETWKKSGSKVWKNAQNENWAPINGGGCPSSSYIVVTYFLRGTSFKTGFAGITEFSFGSQQKMINSRAKICLVKWGKMVIFHSKYRSLILKPVTGTDVWGVFQNIIRFPKFSHPFSKVQRVRQWGGWACYYQIRRHICS